MTAGPADTSPDDARSTDPTPSAPPCAACGVPVPLEDALEHRGWRVYRCQACASWVTHPLPSPSELAEFYRREMPEYTAGMEGDRYLREMPKRFRTKLGALERFVGSGRTVLDVGGGDCIFARVANEGGFSVHVVDYSIRGTPVPGVIAHEADATTAGGIPYDDAAFDVVTMWAVIEHVPDPSAALAEATRVLRPGGLLAMETPLVGDVFETSFAARSHWVCPPEHLHLFSARGLRALALRNGLRLRWHDVRHERSRPRWYAREGRNALVALRGTLHRALDADGWRRARQARETQAGDIQVLFAQKP